MADETVIYITEYTVYTDEEPQETVYSDECPWKQVSFGEAVLGEYSDEDLFL